MAWRSLLLLAVAFSGCVAEDTVARGGPDCTYQERGDNGEFRATARLDCDGVVGRAVVGPIACQDLEIWLGYDLASEVELRLLRDGQEIHAARVSGQHHDDGEPTWDATGEASYLVQVESAPGTAGTLVVGMVCDG